MTQIGAICDLFSPNGLAKFYDTDSYSDIKIRKSSDDYIIKLAIQMIRSDEDEGDDDGFVTLADFQESMDYALKYCKTDKASFTKSYQYGTALDEILGNEQSKNINVLEVLRFSSLQGTLTPVQEFFGKYSQDVIQELKEDLPCARIQEVHPELGGVHVDFSTCV